MMKGDRVKVTGLVSERGHVVESLRIEYEHNVVGRVELGPDAMDWYIVLFPTCNGPLNVPGNCLTRVR